MKNSGSNNKIAVGMSGGVDSSVSLLLLKKQGFEPIGVSLKYDVWQGCEGCQRENVCCSRKSFAIASRICRKLNVEHHIIDVAEDFRREVIDYFTRELRANRTPSPCVVCNPKVKFKALLDFADKIGAQYVATGHYARLCERKLKIKNSKLKNVCLHKAKDDVKDQTYSLSFLTQKELSRLIFPLGELTKNEVFKIARKQAGFEVYEKRKQSQDFCFVAGDQIEQFLTSEIGEKPGEIVDTVGAKLGKHRGLHFYTIGQRKGIGLAGGPYFVVGKDEKHNNLIVSKNKIDSAKKWVILRPYNLISGEELTKTTKITTKIRSTAKEVKAKISPSDVGFLKLEFSKKQEGVTTGQIAVFYDGAICLGGGVINFD